jgi:hypothetical protein
MSNLDDFFKKRDKKKKTAKSKFVTLDTDEFAKKLETLAVETLNDDQEQQLDLDHQDTVSSSANIAPLSTGNLTTTSTTTAAQSSRENNGEQEEEWKPFDSDENKDYSGLKINIQGWKIEDQESGNDANADENEKKTNCPWAAPCIIFFYIY